MSIPQQEVDAIKKLTPQKLLIRYLVTAVVALSSVVGVLAGGIFYMYKETKAKGTIIHDKVAQLKLCLEEKTTMEHEHAKADKEEDRKEIEELKAEGRRKDSITTILNQALLDAEKAKRNAKR